MSVREFKGLSLQFNAAIMSLAHSLVPMGWTPKDGAGEYTIKQVTDLYRTNRGHIYVNPVVAPNDLFDDEEYTYAMYAICTHFSILFGKYPETENDWSRLYFAIGDAMARKFGRGPATMHWQHWLHAYLVGTHLYAERYGYLPVKQKDFVEAFSKYSMEALNTEW